MPRKETNSRPRKSKRRRLLKWGVGLLVFLAVAMVASVEVTSRSSFCDSCHIMEPFYDSWTTDIHSDFDCVSCHIPPGTTNFVAAKLNGLGQVVDDWLHRTSTKPSASVSVMACTRDGCHDMTKVDTSDSTQRGYFFDHANHLGIEYEGIAISCTTCHSHIKGDKHFEVNTNVCIACHQMESHVASPPPTNSVLVSGASSSAQKIVLPQRHQALTAPNRCTSCHVAPKDPFLYQGLEIDHNEFLANGAACESCHRNTTSKPSPVTDAQCLTCHVFGMEAFTDVEDIHQVHTVGAHKVECFNCHGLLRHGPSAQILTLNQFDCANCHVDQHEIQKTEYLSNGNGHGVAPSPDDSLFISPMFLAHVDCTGCHIQQSAVSVKPGSGATVAKAVPSACDKCHQAGFGEQLVPLWQRNTRELYDSVAALLPTDESPWAKGNVKAEELVREARQLVETVRMDGSWGVHNPRFTQELLDVARGKLVEARNLVNGKEGKSQ